MKGIDIDNRARAFVDDDDGSGQARRFKPSDSINYINDAVQRIWTGRTDAQYASDGTLIPYAPISGISDTVCILDNWLEACAHYVAAEFLRRRSGEADNISRIKSELEEFKALTGIEV